MAERDSDWEETKLLANALDRASTSFFTVGFATPVAGFIYNIGGFGANVEWWRLAVGLAGWILAAFALHYQARRILRGSPDVTD